MAQAVAAARECPVGFAQLILSDTDDGRPLSTAPFHHEWHDTIAAHAVTSILAGPELGKTQSITVARTLWELGRNPNLRCGIFSAKQENAENMLRAVREHIESNALVHAVFPKLRPSPSVGHPWTVDQITVERSIVTTNPSVRAFGALAKIQGDRLDFVVGDDCLDHDNTRTQHNRDLFWRWFVMVLRRRMTRTGRLVMLNNAWDPDDAHHRLARSKSPHVAARTYSIVQDDGTSIWPVRWSLKRVQDDAVDMTPGQYAQVFRCRPRSDEDRRFREAWIQRALERGARLISGQIPEGWLVATGVDLASSKRRTAARSVVCTIAGTPDLSEWGVVEVSAGRWSGAEIVEAVVEHVIRFGDAVRVESNAAQRYLQEQLSELLAFRRAAPAPVFDPDRPLPLHAPPKIESAEDSGVVAHFTGSNKHDPVFGVEALAADFQRGLVSIPARQDPDGVWRASTEGLALLVRELGDYEPPPAHTPDSVIALWLAKLELRAQARYAPPRATSADPTGQLERALAELRPREPTDADFAKPNREIIRAEREAKRDARKARQAWLEEQAKRLGLKLP